MLENLLSPLADWGLLVLRLALGITLIVHGWMKVDPKGQVKGPAGFAAWLKQMGVPLPQFFAWVVCLLETAGAVLLILGLGTRILAAAIVVDMMVAIALVKMKVMKAKFMEPKVQGWEFEFALLAQALALVFCGAGGIALDAVAGL